MKATQGNWDPAMRGFAFLAGFGSKDFGPHTEALTAAKLPNLWAVNELVEPGRPVNFNAPKWGPVKASIDSGAATFMDSGIFWLTNEHKRAHGISMDEALSLPPDEIDGFDWLYDVYLEINTTYGDQFWGYNELDQGGKACKIETRAKLEREGLRPIPVYHPLNDGWDYFDDLAREYDRICWGNVVQAMRWTRMRMLVTMAERHRQYPDLFIHVLGLTPNELLFGIPFDSADSSSWTDIYRWSASSSVCAMGKRPVNVPRWTWPPSAEERALWGITEAQFSHLYLAAGMIQVGESHCTTRATRHWWDEVLATLNVPADHYYPPTNQPATKGTP